MPDDQSGTTGSGVLERLKSGLAERHEAIREIERLRAEIHDLGRLSDTCTYHALGTVCGYCECKRKARKNSP